jgi:hypothetical protein
LARRVSGRDPRRLREWRALDGHLLRCLQLRSRLDLQRRWLLRLAWHRRALRYTTAQIARPFAKFLAQSMLLDRDGMAVETDCLSILHPHELTGQAA